MINVSYGFVASSWIIRLDYSWITQDALPCSSGLSFSSLLNISVQPFCSVRSGSCLAEFVASAVGSPADEVGGVRCTKGGFCSE